jgi:hypothetical protein
MIVLMAARGACAKVKKNLRKTNLRTECILKKAPKKTCLRTMRDLKRMPSPAES